MSQLLPAKPSLVFLKKQAKDLLDALRKGDAETAKTFAAYFPPSDKVGLIKAQLVLAREYGFESWSALKRHVENLDGPTPEAFIDSVFAGRLDEAKNWWKEHRDRLAADPAAAAIAGDTDSIRRLLVADPSIVRANLAPKDRPILCYVCISRLISDPDFEPGILGVVDLLLRSGADPDSAFMSKWGTEDWRETALYGAAGVLNHPGLTKLLLDAGADPDDGAIQDGVYHGESIYHSCDFPGHNECLRLLLEANPSQVAADFCIKRKLDFEDEEGVRIFLEHGTNPNASRPRTALSHAILRGRSTKILQLLLDAGADPNQPDEDGTTAYILARRLADKEASALLEAHGARKEFGVYDAILIAAADGDTQKVRKLAREHPDVLTAFTDLGRQENDGLSLGSAGQILHDMARLGHLAALRALLDLGMNPGLVNHQNETPLHWACVAGRAEAARILIERGAPLDIRERDHNCIPIEWTYWGSEYWNEPHGDYGRTTEVLLDAGSPLPKKLQGSAAVQAVLQERGVE